MNSQTRSLMKSCSSCMKSREKELRNLCTNVGRVHYNLVRMVVVWKANILKVMCGRIREQEDEQGPAA